MNTTEKTAMQIVAELAAHRNTKEEEKRLAKQHEADAKLHEQLDFWKPVHDILQEAATTYPSKIMVQLCTLNSRTKWHAIRDGLSEQCQLARYNSFVTVENRAKILVRGNTPADLIPEVLSILADMIRK